MNYPKPDEYADYYSRYIKQIPDNENIIKVLQEDREKLQSLIKSIPEDRGNYSYAEGKWTVKEVFGHLADVERVMTYRAMCIARGEKKSIPGFEQDDYVRMASFNRRTLKNISEELLHLRNSAIVLFNSFDEETLLRRGTANNNEVSVRALLFIIAGHELHHMKILNERYLQREII